MLTTLEISVGTGQASLNVAVRRGGGSSTGRRLGLVTVVLVLPIVVVLGGQAIGLLTGWYSLDRLMNAPGAPWVYVLSVSTLGVLLALATVLAVRLKLAFARSPGSWRLALTLRLTAIEALVLGIGGALLVLFVGHLLADALACARGVHTAC
jgi:hypothetical protein